MARSTVKKKGDKGKYGGRLDPDKLPLGELLDVAECRLREAAKVEGEIRVHAVYPESIAFRVQPPLSVDAPDPLGLGTYPWECKTAIYDEDADDYVRVVDGWPVI